MNIYKNFSMLGLIFICCIFQANANDSVIQDKVGQGVFTPEKPPAVTYKDSKLTLEPIYATDQIFIRMDDQGAVMLQMNLDFTPPPTMELCGVSQRLTNRQFHII